MKIFNILSLSLILLSGAVSWADSRAAGKWTGWGIWTYDGSGTNCNMVIQFSETDGEFKRDGGTFDCNIVALYSDPLTWKKSGGDLLLDNSIMGNFHDNYVQTAELINDHTKAVMTLEITGNKAHYLEIWYTDGKVLYRIEGDMKRAAN
jgi:hypothetical protein